MKSSRNAGKVERKGKTRLDALVRFLMNPKSYPHRPRRVKLLQTHASLVFVAGPWVYKVKKPVDFGFLNFSTLDARRKDCEQEVRLNQRLAPHVYKGVVPILNCEGRFTLGDVGVESVQKAGCIVEYAVLMKTLEREGFLDQMLAAEKLKPGHLDRVANILTHFYRKQRPAGSILRWGKTSRVRLSTGENFRQLKPFAGRTLSRECLHGLRRYTRQFLSRNERLFEKRVRERRILDCHGDLHLEHIHFSRRAEEVSIYDCIEFNERFRYVDVASDLAFLGMDLDFRGRRDLSRHWMRAMAGKLHDEGILKLYRFYACYRAVVRGKVESFQSEAPQASSVERSKSSKRASRYFQLALRYAVTGVEPCVWVIMGGIGSGKSTVARGLHRELGWLSGSSDVYRKQLGGIPLMQRTPSRKRAAIYSSDMTKLTYLRLAELAEMEIRAGRQVVLDATYGTRELRASLVKAAGRWKVPVRFIELRASAAQVRQRLKLRRSRGGEISDARLEDWDALKRRYEPPTELEDVMVRRVMSDSDEPRTLDKVLRVISDWTNEAEIDS